MDKLYDPGEVSKLLNIPQARILQFLEQGRIYGVKTLRSWIISQREIDKLKAQGVTKDRFRAEQ